MAVLFKDLYSKEFFTIFTKVLDNVITDFNTKKFITEIYISEWENMEFKQRMFHISSVMRSYLSIKFEESTNQIFEIISALKAIEVNKTIKYAELAFIFIPDFIEKNGINEFETSVSAFEKITEFTSCEFAVRPFIIKYENKMLERVLVWTKHENQHIRRLASEGSRPRLPWGIAIKELKKNPQPLIPILESLKNDPSEYVRKSVANNLNDISKDNPQIISDIAKLWKGKSKETDWIIKHACRTLLKAGNKEIMQLFGFCNPDEIELKKLSLRSNVVKIGEELEFSFQLQNKALESKKIRLEYAIYYLKKNSSLSKKIFKISEKDYLPMSVTTLHRRQSFRLISTRKYHVGKHVLGIIINGIEFEKIEIELKE